MNEHTDTFNRVISIVGSQRALAKILDVTPTTVYHWQKRGFPLKRVFDIEKATNGKVTRAELAPAIFPVEVL